MITVPQCKQIIAQYMSASGRGGFLIGKVISVNPLAVTLENGLSLIAADLYVTENCIGLSMSLKHSHESGSGKTEESLKNKITLRRPLQTGDSVILLSRPQSADGEKYILLDRIQPYSSVREVNAI